MLIIRNGKQSQGLSRPQAVFCLETLPAIINAVQQTLLSHPAQPAQI